ncbi:MAG: electron transport complex subunit RsxC, partial [Gammaproteobacteria bacterium]|nr:electron transport complex subunit RsxC [Gammaproteobacteria bacterium]
TPQQLYWYSKAKEFEKAQEYSLFDCIECGCCDYVCPSKIPLVQYYRYAKSEIWAHDRETKKSDLARERFEARQARLEREKAEKEERLKKKKQSLTDEPELKTGKVTKTDPKQAAILAAMERVNAKKKQENIAPKNTDNLSPDQQEKIKAIDEARAKNKPHNEGAE